MLNYKLRVFKEMGEIVNSDKLRGDTEVFVIAEDEGQSETSSEEVRSGGVDGEDL